MRARTTQPGALGFALASLATWRVSHLLAEEDGPFDLVVRLRSRAGSGELGALMDCFYCLSIWTAAPLAVTLTTRRRDLPVAWLAVSGAACLLEQVSHAGPRRPLQDEPEGAGDVLWAEPQGSRL
jgi:uncharacterized protein DUF1360